jgi:hypothetical protein
VEAHADFSKAQKGEMFHLTASEPWQKLTEAQRTDILRPLNLAEVPAIQTGTEGELIASLDRLPLDQWATRRDALPQRFQKAVVEAARLLTPTAVHITLPHATIEKIEEFDAWVAQVRQEVLKRLADGPVVL